jgi:hypothetical protein
MMKKRLIREISTGFGWGAEEAVRRRLHLVAHLHGSEGVARAGHFHLGQVPRLQHLHPHLQHHPTDS